MVKRSLQASLPGIQQAKQAFALKGWTQENLAGEVNLKTRQPIWRFFTGRPVERHIFQEVCSVLDLNWREIAIDPPAEFSDSGEFALENISDIEGLVGKVRSQRQEKIQDQCGILQLWDVSHPLQIEDIYVDVNVLEKIASKEWFELAYLQHLSAEDFDHAGLGEMSLPQLSGMRAVERYSKLRVLGKPGSGKTTFLQHLAIQCNQGGFAADRVPIFISLKNFAEETRNSQECNLLDYIQQEFLLSGISDLSVIETLLQAGRVLLLLDGMDEVLNQESMAVMREVRKFADKYHKNLFVATCRTADQKLQLRGFTDVEIAPFTSAQITAFTQKWFVAFTKTNAKNGQAQSAQFMQKLDLPENWQFRRLVVTPLFLHLACWVFHAQDKFPSKQVEFYKQGLDLLLGQWDAARGIERDDVYRGFLLPQKLKLLSQIAAATFEQGQYFFEQRVIEQYIGDSIREMPDAPIDLEQLQLDSEAVLRAIEAQHGLLTERVRGIFSFSYLIFQEYFTARKIVASHNLQSLEQGLEGLVSHITDPHWREIFLLTAAMLRSADGLVQLMKQKIDNLIAQDSYLQEFLAWASQKSRTISAAPKLATTRALYLALAQTPLMAFHFALASALDQGILLDAELDDLLLNCTIDRSQDFDHARACSSVLDNILVIVQDIGFHKSLQQLSDELPNPDQNEGQFQDWWQTRYATWFERLHKTIIDYRNINHPWQFSPEQEQVLQRYYEANQLLLDCLNSNCAVTAATRQEIKAALLLPQKELEEREWQ